jgi:CheY-like chemotaxis protein
VLVAHQRSDVRHALRSMIEAEEIAVDEAPDGEAALLALARKRFDLIVVELDLPIHDGVTVMQLHRVLLTHGAARVDPPSVILTLAAEVRGNAALTDHLRTLGIAGFIDDAPRAGAAELIEATLQTRATQQQGKPAAA